MATENDFLPFANGSSANVLSQSAYAALTSLLQNGFTAGIAQSNQLNKVWRQSSIMSAVLAQFIVNSTGQPAIDDGTTATLLTNLTAAVRANSEALIGSVRNLSMNIAAASASATLSADEIVVGSAFGGLKYTLASFSKVINLATTGAGGMDTGSAPVSGYVAIYAIYNPSTQVAALLATNATSAAASNVYAGANMPSGYTASALVSVWPTNGSSQLIVGAQCDRKIFPSPVSVFSISTLTSTPSSFSLAGAVPKNARSYDGIVQAAFTTVGAGVNANVYASSAGLAQKGFSTVAAASSGQEAESFSDLPILASQTSYYSLVTTSGGSTITVFVTAYLI